MLGMNKSHRHSLGLDRAALVSADDLVGIKPFRAEPCADLEVGHDRRLRAPRDLQGVVDVVKVAVGDEHEVAPVDVLQLLGRDRVVHDPRVDEDLLALGAPSLPGPVPDPGEADVSVQRHRFPPFDADRKSRFSHTAKTKIPTPATVHRFGKNSSQGWRKKPSRQTDSKPSVIHRRRSTALTSMRRVTGSSGNHWYGQTSFGMRAPSANPIDMPYAEFHPLRQAAHAAPAANARALT